MTASEFASFLRISVSVAFPRMDLVELAEGLVADEVGTLAVPWPATAKAVVLAAASRAFYNPAGLRQETAGGVSDVFMASECGVFLTQDERARLHRIMSNDDTSRPRGSFPAADAWPDQITTSPGPTIA